MPIGYRGDALLQYGLAGPLPDAGVRLQLSRSKNTSFLKFPVSPRNNLIWKFFHTFLYRPFGMISHTGYFCKNFVTDFLNSGFNASHDNSSLCLLKERMEELPYKIIPGETGNFRNDVFLERAIVGERLRLAMGLPNRTAAEHRPGIRWH